MDEREGKTKNKLLLLREILASTAPTAARNAETGPPELPEC